MNTNEYHYRYNRLPPLAKPQREGTRLRSVRQDKPLPTSTPRSFPTASPSTKAHAPLFNGHKNTTDTKTHQEHAPKRQKVKLYIWVDPPEKHELQRFAESEGLSVSETGRAIIVDGLQQKLRIEREALAEPLMRKIVREEIIPVLSKGVFFQARNAYEIGTIRRIVTAIFGKQPGMTQPELEKKIAEYNEDTRKYLFRKTPQLVSIFEALKQWLFGEGKEP